MASRLFRISALASNELMMLLVAMGKWDRETRKQIRRHSKAVIQPIWQAEMNSRASTPLEHAVLARSARAQVSDQNVTLRAATSNRPLSGGLRPKQQWQPVEFGAGNAKQFKRPNRKGYVFYPSAASIIPRVAALWVQTAVRTFHELREGANRG